MTSILRNSFFMTLFNLFGRAAGFIRYTVLVYFLSDIHFSLISYAFSFSRLGRHFTDGGLDNFISRDGARKHDDIPSFLFHGLILKGALALIYLFFTLIYLRSARDFSWIELAVVYATLGGSAMLSLTGVLRSCFTANERMEYVFYTNIPVRIVSVLLLFAVLVLSYPMVSIEGVALLEKATWFLSTPLIFAAGAVSLENVLWFFLLGFIASRFFPLKTKFSFSTIFYMIVESWPLALYGFFNVFYISLDVFMIEYIMGKDAVAPYTYASMLIEGITMLVSGYFIAIYPVMSRYYATDEEAYQRLFRLSVTVLCAVTVPVSILLSFWPHEWANFIKETSPISGEVLRVLGITLNVSMLNTLIIIVFTSRNQQRWLVAFTAGALGVSFLTNLIFIHRFGQIGAAYASLLSQTLLLVVMGSIAWRKFALQFPLAKPVGIIAVSLCAGCVTWVIPGIPLLIRPFIFGSLLVLLAFATRVLTLDEIQRFRASTHSIAE